VAIHADAGYFAGQLACAAHEARIAFAVGAKRIAPLWRLLPGIAEDAWHDAIEMDSAQVAVAQYCPDWCPADTRLLVRRVALDPAQVSADPKSRRRRTCTRTSAPCRSPSWRSSPPSTPTRASGKTRSVAVVVEYSAAGFDLGLRHRHDLHPCVSRWLTGCW
jgi:hypothetical protein